MAAGFYLSASPVDSQTEPCASALGQMLTRDGGELTNELEVLSWNIQKASNTGWAEDLASFGSDIDLAFIQEASVQAQIGQVIPAGLYQAFAAG